MPTAPHLVGLAASPPPGSVMAQLEAMRDRSMRPSRQFRDKTFLESQKIQNFRRRQREDLKQAMLREEEKAHARVVAHRRQVEAKTLKLTEDSPLSADLVAQVTRNEKRLRDAIQREERLLIDSAKRDAEIRQMKLCQVVASFDAKAELRNQKRHLLDAQHRMRATLSLSKKERIEPPKRSVSTLLKSLADKPDLVTGKFPFALRSVSLPALDVYPAPNPSAPPWERMTLQEMAAEALEMAIELEKADVRRQAQVDELNSSARKQSEADIRNERQHITTPRTDFDNEAVSIDREVAGLGEKAEEAGPPVDIRVQFVEQSFARQQQTSNDDEDKVANFALEFDNPTTFIESERKPQVVVDVIVITGVPGGERDPMELLATVRNLLADTYRIASEAAEAHSKAKEAVTLSASASFGAAVLKSGLQSSPYPSPCNFVQAAKETLAEAYRRAIEGLSYKRPTFASESTSALGLLASASVDGRLSRLLLQDETALDVDASDGSPLPDF